jgi:hypothetical protein
MILESSDNIGSLPAVAIRDNGNPIIVSYNSKNGNLVLTQVEMLPNT